MTTQVSPPNRPNRRIMIGMIVGLSTLAILLVCVAIAVYIVSGPPVDYKPIPFDRVKLDEIARGVEDGSLHVAKEPQVMNDISGGAVILPKGLASASVTGRAYVTTDTGYTVIFVPSWIGRTADGGPHPTDNSWIEGYYYCPDPASFNPKDDDRFSIIYVPAFCDPADVKRDKDVGDVQMWIDRPAGGNWFYADSFS